MKTYTFIKAYRKRTESVQNACTFNKSLIIKALKKRLLKQRNVTASGGVVGGWITMQITTNIDHELTPEQTAILTAYVHEQAYAVCREMCITCSNQ